MQGHGGVGLAVRHDGRLVVDLVAGDLPTDGLHLLFSVTKVMTAVVAARLHGDGRLDLDAPLADQWPELDRPPVAGITTRMVLGHRSGLAELDRALSLDELLAGEDEAAIAHQEPFWEPGTRHGYHAFTLGTLVGGVIRRATGRTVGDLVADEIARPLAADLYLGAPSHVLPRVQQVTYASPVLTEVRRDLSRTSNVPPSQTARLNTVMDLYNDRRALQACWPSTTGIAGARDLATLGASLLDEVGGVRLLDEDALRGLVRPLSCGPDVVLGIPTAFGSGVQLPFPQLPLLGAGSFGHEGAGGSVLAVAPSLGLAVAVTTGVHPALAGASPAALALLPAVGACLADDPALA
jgi:CubicO group peptidase (beta-lactamase class C family)